MANFHFYYILILYFDTHNIINEMTMNITTYTSFRIDAAGCVECCGYISEKLGHSQDAARLLGAARAIRERTEVPLFNFWLPYHRAAHASLEAQLGAEEYAACSRAGAVMREEEVLEATTLRLKSFSAGAGQETARQPETNSPRGS